MIAGSFAFSSVEDTGSFTEHIRSITDCEGLTFHRFLHDPSRGGYYLNHRLPYKEEDIYFYDETEDLVVVLSGVVYNREELLHHCGIAGQATDPRLIAALFLHEGPAFVSMINGDFAIFVARPRKREAYLFRDQVGIAPMAYSVRSGVLYFCSDIIGLCRVFHGSDVIENDFLLGHFKYIDYSKTPSESVIKLLPGHFLRVSEEGVKLTCYWDPEDFTTDHKLTYEQMMSDLGALVHDAVKIRCSTGFTAGAHVSSGIDSGIVATLARKEYPGQKDFYGFSWSPAGYVPSDVNYDERELVVSSCQKTDITPRFSEMKVDNFAHYVSSCYSNHGYFYEDRISDQAAALNVNLLFSGWGGDEFISAGDRGIDQDLLRGLKLKLFFRRNPLNRPRLFARWMLTYIILPAAGILDRSTARSFRDDARYIRKPFKKSNRKALRNYYFHTSRHRLHLGLLRFYHLQERCESWAVTGFRKGIEYRYPLLDKRIIEYMLRVPSELFCMDEHYHYRPLLREIGKGILPDEVRLNRLKNDPVCWAYVGVLFNESAPAFMKEVDHWKRNPDLWFVDFDLLEADIARYRENRGRVDTRVLFRALVYLKAVCGFSEEFHR